MSPPRPTALDWIRTPPTQPLTDTELVEARAILLDRVHSGYEVAIVERLVRQAALAKRP